MNRDFCEYDRPASMQQTRSAELAREEYPLSLQGGPAMSRCLKTLCLLCCLFVLKPIRADYSALEVPAFGFSGPTVTVSVHNPTDGSTTARVRVAVQLEDDIFYRLTSSNFTVSGGGTISVSMTAPGPVAIIDDIPEPIPSAQ